MGLDLLFTSASQIALGHRSFDTPSTGALGRVDCRHLFFVFATVSPGRNPSTIRLRRSYGACKRVYKQTAAGKNRRPFALIYFSHEVLKRGYPNLLLHFPSAGSRIPMGKHDLCFNKMWSGYRNSFSHDPVCPRRASRAPLFVFEETAHQ